MNSAEQLSLTITSREAGQRLDVLAVSQVPTVSRAVLQRAIKAGSITVNGQVMKPRYLVKVDDVVLIQIPNDHPSADGPMTTTRITTPLPTPTILFEDKDIVVIDKPAGVTVHPGVGTPPGGTIADWFRARYPDITDAGDDPTRLGIVHRLDKDTSGVLVLAKTHDAYQYLKHQWKKHHAKKEYLALVYGVPGESKGRINRPLVRSARNPMRRTVVASAGGYGHKKIILPARGVLPDSARLAITEWRREEVFQGRYALLRVFPETGRTHQIRAHLHWLGFPIVGDNLYTFKRQRPPAGVTRHLLHAEALTLVMPNKDKKTFIAPLAKDFEHVLERLRSND